MGETYEGFGPSLRGDKKREFLALGVSNPVAMAMVDIHFSTNWTGWHHGQLLIKEIVTLRAQVEALRIYRDKLLKDWSDDNGRATRSEAELAEERLVSASNHVELQRIAEIVGMEDFTDCDDIEVRFAVERFAEERRKAEADRDYARAMWDKLAVLVNPPGALERLLAVVAERDEARAKCERLEKVIQAAKSVDAAPNQFTLDVLRAALAECGEGE